MFRIADGEALGYDDPPLRGHSFEFRINGEDPGRGFLPAPRHASPSAHPPSGPGVRVDAGVEAGDVIGGSFDSLLAKLIVTGATREQALERSRRALDEFEVEGMATALPFHRAVVARPGVRPDRRDAVHASTPAGSRPSSTTRSRPYSGAAAADAGRAERAPVASTVEVGGKRLEVSLPGRASRRGGGAPRGRRRRRRKRRAAKKAGAAASGDSLAAPMQGTIVKVAVEEGQGSRRATSSSCSRR